MAIADNSFDTLDDEQMNQQNGSGPAQPSTQLSGGGSGFAGQSSGGASSGKPSSSGSWTNLDSYLKANSDQATNVGNTLAQTVGNSAQSAQSALNQTNQDFQNQYSNIPTQDVAHNSIASILGDYANDTAGSSNVNQYQNFLNNSYNYTDAAGNSASNPWSLQSINGANGQNEWSNTQNAYQQAANNLTNTQSEAGRDSLLNSQYGNNGKQYNSGEQNLDQYLLESNRDNQNTLNNVYNQYASGIVPTSSNGMSADLNNALTGAQTYASNIANTQKTIQSDAAKALQDAIANGTQSVQGGLTSAQSARDAEYNSLASALQNNSLSADQLKALGLTQGINTYGVTPSQYLSAEGSPLTANQTATADQFAMAKAYQALAAGQSYANTANLGLGANQETAAPAYTFNKDSFNQAVQTNQNAYNTGTAQANQALSQDQSNINAWQQIVNSLGITNTSDNNGIIRMDGGLGGSGASNNMDEYNAYEAKISQAQQDEAAQNAALQSLISQYNPTGTLQ